MEAARRRKNAIFLELIVAFTSCYIANAYE
jgi:hypothetical protein